MAFPVITTFNHLQKDKFYKMAAPKNNKNAIGNEGGAPSLYKQEYAEQVYKLCLLGSTDKEIADFFNISVRTLNNWKKEQIEFLQSLKKGKTIADANVAERLYIRAMGYTFEETTFEKIDSKLNLEVTPNELITVEAYKKRIVLKEVVPDTTAQIFFLKNRQKEKWRDKQHLAVDVDYEKMDDRQLDYIIEGLKKQVK